MSTTYDGFTATAQQPPSPFPADILEPVRVHFGPLARQEIRLEVAEVMLRAWHDKDPKRFGEALREALMAGGQP